jgi:hypothetical protein
MLCVCVLLKEERERERERESLCIEEMGVLKFRFYLTNRIRITSCSSGHSSGDSYSCEKT